MTLKKDSKKLAKSSKNKKPQKGELSFVKNKLGSLLESLTPALAKVLDSIRGVGPQIKGYYDSQKMTNGDRAFAGAMVMVSLFILIIIGQSTADSLMASRSLSARPNHLVKNGLKQESPMQVLVKGVQSTEARGKAINPSNLKLPILMYHRIDANHLPGEKDPFGLMVSPANFESQLIYLKQNGYSTIGLDDLYKAFYTGQKLPAKSVILTFDDGFQDNYTYAFPLLKKYQYKGTFFVVTGYTNNNPHYMTSAEIEEMSDSGMDIESHTVSHLHLDRLTPEQVTKELSESKKALRELTGKDIFFMAYPFGSYSLSVAQTAQNSGYIMAVTTKPGKNQVSTSPFDLERIMIRPNTNIPTFANIVR
jgi:peptidoglycan/xylan/chitin deacetylase (PgdA/CDA1 family)